MALSGILSGMLIVFIHLIGNGVCFRTYPDAGWDRAFYWLKQGWLDLAVLDFS